ncbi:phage tail protein, partial [Paraburkholderia sp. 31.1]|uniref:phage tail tube protein n=1 Tax=Paraburkholderia sp. 31.1 TaxID=2615205 RepID=UPI0016555D84
MSDDTNRLAGVAWISMDGQNYMLSGELAYSPADYERESLVGQDRVHGYAEKPRAPFISATLRDAGTLTVKDF